MNRLTSLFTHAGLITALVLPVATPALAQSAPSSPRINPNVVAPATMPAGHDLQQAAQGQTPPAMAPPAPRADTPRAPSISSQNNPPMPAATNIRLELTISDTYTGTPVKKTVSLLILTGNNGMIRARGADGFSVLNVDAIAQAYQNGQVSLRMTFEYTPASPKDATTNNRPPTLNESITVVLQDGKAMMVSQSADPGTDRKVTAELTATILK